jgi:hypothetical protein
MDESLQSRPELHKAFHWDDERPRVVLDKTKKIILATSYPLSLLQMGSLVNAYKYTAVSADAATSICII